MVLDRSLRVIQASSGARRRSAAWLSSPHGSERDTRDVWPFSAEIADACRSLDTEWRAILRRDPDTTAVPRKRSVASLHRPELTASITMVTPHAPGLAEPMFVVDLHRRSSGTVGTPVDASSLLRSLTEAERAVALVLANGLSNQEIADHLGKTVHAVKFLLHRVYKRTGLPNRAAVVAAIRDPDNRPLKHPHG